MSECRGDKEGYHKHVPRVALGLESLEYGTVTKSAYGIQQSVSRDRVSDGNELLCTENPFSRGLGKGFLHYELAVP